MNNRFRWTFIVRCKDCPYDENFHSRLQAMSNYDHHRIEVGHKVVLYRSKNNRVEMMCHGTPPKSGVVIEGNDNEK